MTAPLAKDVGLFSSPWITGTKTEAHYGMVEAVLFVPDSAIPLDLRVEAAEAAVLEDIQAKAADLGANAVVGIELVVNAFASREVPGMLFESSRVSRQAGPPLRIAEPARG